MITDEYLDIIQESLEPVRFLLPGNSQLLFATLVDSTILMEGLLKAEAQTNGIKQKQAPLNDLKGIIASRLNGNEGLYNECFVLVELSDEDSSIFLPIKKCLILPVPEQEDMLPGERLKKVVDWLSLEDKDSDYCFEFFREDIRPDGWRIFIPSAVPPRYESPGDDCAFISIFQ